MTGETALLIIIYANSCKKHELPPPSQLFPTALKIILSILIAGMWPQDKLFIYQLQQNIYAPI